MPKTSSAKNVAVKPAASKSKQPPTKAAKKAAPSQAKSKREKPAKPEKPAPASPKKAATGKPSAPSKQDTVLTLLREPTGATIAAMEKATGWQQHSVRGFLAGTVRKKLKLNLVSEKTDGERRYRIKAAGAK